jgi:hypothetical protein
LLATDVRCTVLWEHGLDRLGLLTSKGRATGVNTPADRWAPGAARPDYRARVHFDGNVCRLTEVVAVLILEPAEPAAGESLSAHLLAPSPDDPVVAFFGRRGRAATRLFSCYYRSIVLGRPADAPLAIDVAEGPPVPLSAADWETLRAWLRRGCRTSD